MKHGCTAGLNDPIKAMAIPKVAPPVGSVHVAALFVDPRGPYPELLGAERCWDADRDARTYAGPWPVVAHPPCQLWVNFAALNFKRYGGEHNRPGNDGGCFAAALAAVREFGGVLEHPAFSNAWEAHGLTRPPKGRTGWFYNRPLDHLRVLTGEVCADCYNVDGEIVPATETAVPIYGPVEHLCARHYDREPGDQGEDDGPLTFAQRCEVDAREGTR